MQRYRLKLISILLVLFIVPLSFVGCIQSSEISGEYAIETMHTIFGNAGIYSEFAENLEDITADLNSQSSSDSSSDESSLSESSSSQSQQTGEITPQDDVLNDPKYQGDLSEDPQKNDTYSPPVEDTLPDVAPPPTVSSSISSVVSSSSSSSSSSSVSTDDSSISQGSLSSSLSSSSSVVSSSSSTVEPPSNGWFVDGGKHIFT